MNIGSNLGDRHALIKEAIDRLHNALAPCTVDVADPVESEPWGYESDNKFLNVGIKITILRDIAPSAIFAVTQLVEQAVGEGAPHRNDDGSYRDRPIDIDIIAIDRLTLNTPELTIPHPRAHLRPFVLIPLAQLDKSIHDWIIMANRSKHTDYRSQH